MTHPTYTLATWYLPKPLYNALSALQKALKGRDGTPKWGSIEALATHFLMVAVQEAHQELAQKAQQVRLVQPAAVVPRALVRGASQSMNERR